MSSRMNDKSDESNSRRRAKTEEKKFGAKLIVLCCLRLSVSASGRQFSGLQRVLELLGI